MLRSANAQTRPDNVILCCSSSTPRYALTHTVGALRKLANLFRHSEPSCFLHSFRQERNPFVLGCCFEDPVVEPVGLPAWTVGGESWSWVAPPWGIGGDVGVQLSEPAS